MLRTSTCECDQRVRTFAKRNDLVFVVPERVYEELTSADSSERLTAEPIPVDVAIDEGWVRVADPLEYTNPLVSKTMDDIQRYIASVWKFGFWERLCVSGRYRNEFLRRNKQSGARSPYHNLVVFYFATITERKLLMRREPPLLVGRHSAGGRLVHGNDEAIKQIQKALRLQAWFQLVDSERLLHQ
jgi:hypothetical protein